MHLIAVTVATLLIWGGSVQSGKQKDRDWQTVFSVDKKTLGVVGKNPYLDLTPGYQVSFRHDKELQVIKVLNEVKRIDGVDTRPVSRSKYDANGKLVEQTRNYYAIDSVTNDVYYFGKDVTDLDKADKADEEGKEDEGKIIKNKESSWFSGVSGATFGLMMPACPRAGQKFYQEQAPAGAMDRVEIASITEKLNVPAGKFSNVVHVIESTPLEIGETHKFYVSGIGLVKDKDMVLVQEMKK